MDFHVRWKPLLVVLIACLCCDSLLPACCGAFSTTVTNHHRRSRRSDELVVLRMSEYSARDLLYQDQQKAMLRRSLYEQELLKGCKELKAPKLKATVQRGTGFSSRMADEKTRLATQQAKVVRKDGVLRINQALSVELADKLLEYTVEQQRLARIATEADPSLSRSFYGVEQGREHRCDLQLSLLRGGFAADDQDNNNNGEIQSSESSHILADVLQELLGEQGSLRPVYEKLVTTEGEFYELAAVITQAGSHRQIMHPDLPFQDEAPLYVIFVALQDVDEAMGPTTFLLGTHTSKENAKFNDSSQKDEQISSANCRLSLLKKGDAVLFDARILHCGNANDPVHGKTRALFNFSFRNPQVSGNLGYEGSIRPAYCQAMTLGDLSDCLQMYRNGDLEPFAKYGSGLVPRAF